MKALTLLDAPVTSSQVIVREVAIAVCVGLAYYALLVINPASYLYGLALLQPFAHIRWANMLRTSVIAIPSAAFGICGASYLFKMQTGKLAMGMYPVTSFVILWITLSFSLLLQKWGRSLTKDLIIITLIGASVAVVSSLNTVAIAMITEGSTWTKLISFALLWKIIIHVLVMWVSYPVVRYFESVFHKKGR